MEDYYSTPKKKGSFFKGLMVGLLSASVVFSIIGGLVYRFVFQPQGIILDDETRTKVGLLYSLIQTKYYKDADKEDLSNGVLKGLVEGLGDPYSAYYTKEEYDEFLVDATGVYAGIGAVLSKAADTGVVTILKVYDGSPAAEAGLKEGDVLKSADGFEGTDLELSEFVHHIRGKEGTNVTLEIIRDTKTMEFEVTRRSITVPTISYRMLKDSSGNEVIGYVNMSEFAEGTDEEFTAAVEDLRQQGATSIIYDIRDNPGGMLTSVTNILDYLLGEGTTVYMVESDGTRTDYTSAAESHVDLPTVVLVNGNSASASEIFSGAIRDYDYGTLVGSTTYGKGVVQNTFPLQDGSAVKLTVASYYTPKGESIQDKGITPDVEVEYEYTGETTGEDYDYYKDSQVQKAIELLSKGK